MDSSFRWKDNWKENWDDKCGWIPAFAGKTKEDGSPTRHGGQARLSGMTRRWRV